MWWVWRPEVHSSVSSSVISLHLTFKKRQGFIYSFCWRMCTWIQMSSEARGFRALGAGVTRLAVRPLAWAVNFTWVPYKSSKRTLNCGATSSPSSLLLLNLELTFVNCEWWHTPEILPLRQEDCHKFQDSLSTHRVLDQPQLYRKI